MADRSKNDRKARQNEDIDFVADVEMRKHRRVGSKALRGIPVMLKPAPPFFGEAIKGTMVDLSGGGTAVVIAEPLPVDAKMKIWIRFPEREAVNCLVSIRRVSAVADGYLTGVQFLDLTDPAAAELTNMSTDYDACEKRINLKEPPYCAPSCAFYELCDKTEKK